MMMSEGGSHISIPFSSSFTKALQPLWRDHQQRLEEVHRACAWLANVLHRHPVNAELLRQILL